MSLLINLRKLENDAVRLDGQILPPDLELTGVDELIHVNQPLKYALTAEKLETSILAQGRLELTLDCECVRCLKPFKYRVQLNDWVCHLPLEGDEKAVVSDDCVDLTPYIREDMLLEFPQHPLCEPECGGLPVKAVGRKKSAEKSTGGTGKDVSSAWSELNKLKL